MRIGRIYLFIMFLLLSLYGKSQNSFVFTNANNSNNYIGKSISFFNDDSGNLKINDIKNSLNFKSSLNEVPNFGFLPGNLWLKFQIQNNSLENNLLLELHGPLIDEVEFFYSDENENFKSEMFGQTQVFSKRKYKYPSYLFDIEIQKGTCKTFFLRINSNDQIEVPITINTKLNTLSSLSSRDFYFGIFCGIMLIMLFYNIFIYFTIKDNSYLLYVIYILSVLITQATFQGYTFKYLWPNWPNFEIISIHLSSIFVGFASVQFLRVFLKTKELVPKLDVYLKFSYILYSIAAIIVFLGFLKLGWILILCIVSPLSLFMLIVSLRISKLGYRNARIFAVAWSVFLIGVFIFAMKDFGFLPYNFVTVYTMPIGSAIEACLLSFALADRINTYRKEKEQSQAQTLNALKENERIIKEQNITLEKKVKERTAELETSNKNLKDAEVNLVNAEKMAGLGQLTAGIAHEINNPINFVVANIAPLKRDISEVLLILDKYNDIKDGENLSEKLKEINDLKKKLDINYVSEEINLLLKGIDEGAGRTSEIVKGLQNFSRMDEGDLKLTDIHEGINSTLNLLNSNLKDYRINVDKDYGTIPKIECFPGKLNQVFMNLLNNSIHAIKSHNNPLHQGEIIIKTFLEESNVCINITDNGIGISQKNLSKVFEPFFTTKDIGEGTGLGLSIVYGIIKAHKGTIEVSSLENKSTTFLIKIPLAQ